MPPHDLDAEAALIAAVMADVTALPKVEDFLRPEHFYSEAHRRIFEAALAVRQSGVVVDAVTIASRLRATGRYDQVGGIEFITDLWASTPAITNVRAYGLTVFERARLRALIRTCQQAAAAGYLAEDTQEHAERVVRAVAEIARHQPDSKSEENFETLRRIVRQLHAAANGEVSAEGHGRGILTGLKPYDEATLGLFAGQKTTIVARPRVGKTALAWQFAVSLAKLGIGIGVWSTEMPREELGDRQLAMLARVDSRRIRAAKQKPTLTPEEWSRIALAMDEVERSKPRIHVFDDASPTVDDICARAKALHEQSMMLHRVPLGLVVVDYVQRLRPSQLERSTKRLDQIAYSTERLKSLARELKLPVIELAQQKNSQVDRGTGKRPKPQLGDAAECFQIERSADNVVYLYRPAERDGRAVKCFIAKQRGGQEAEFDLVFEQEYSRFVEAHPLGPMRSPSRQYIDDPEDP
ncbi:MAG: replicative DNA helicase [Sandaracinaceae bacterium]